MFLCSSVHWIVPTVVGCFLAISLLLVFVAYLNYLVDTYLMYVASAIAANTIARAACAATAPLFTNRMFAALGIGGGGSLIGGVATVLAVVPFAFYKYGRQIRARSKFAPTDLKREERVADEETADPTSYDPDISNSDSFGSASANAPTEKEEPNNGLKDRAWWSPVAPGTLLEPDRGLEVHLS